MQATSAEVGFLAACSVASRIDWGKPCFKNF